MNLRTSPQLNQLLTTLRQPQWIAALVSLGFHGVLFAAGPSFSSLSVAALEGNGAELNERRVPLIELSPEEQSRLPDFSTPDFSFFPDEGDDLFNLFPPSGSSLPLDPNSGFSSSPIIPTPRFPSNPFSTGISPFSLPSGRTSIAVPPRRSTLPSLPGSIAPPEGVNRSSSEAAILPPVPDSNAAENGARPNPDEIGSRPNGSRLNNGGDQSLPADLADAPSDTPEINSRASDLLARVEYSETQTSRTEVEFAQTAWLAMVKDKLGDNIVQAESPITLEVPYSGRLCLSPEPTEGLLGVVGLPNETDNTLTPWTAVLKSTGYPFLNQLAEQAVRDIGQGEADEAGLEPNTLYQVVVKINYDSETCITREALLQSRVAEDDDDESEPELAD